MKEQLNLQIRQRTPQQKSKDILIAQMQQKLNAKQNNETKIKKVIVIVLIHIIVLSICIPLSIFYGKTMRHRMMRPEHCVFYSINLKEDFRAECNLCEDGFIKDKNQLGCIPTTA